MAEKTFDREFIRDISERIYRNRLEDASGGGKGSSARMIAKDGDNGEKLRGRAGCYDQLSRAYLDVFGFTPDNLPTTLR